MKYAMLATKEDVYISDIERLSEGSSFNYPTCRVPIIEKLEPNDIIMLRIQGTGDVVIKSSLLNLNGNRGARSLELRIDRIIDNPISTKEFYEKTGIKAGAENGWINEAESINWIDSL